MGLDEVEPEQASVRSYRLSTRLWHIRVGAQIAVETVAVRTGLAAATVRRIEAGVERPTRNELELLLDFYGIHGSARDDLRRAWATFDSKPRWWRPYDDILDNGDHRLLCAEDEARSIDTYQAALVPGLIQSAGYAQALINTQQDVPLADLEQRMALRMARQQILARTHTPRLSVIIDEAVLRRPVGGWAVMRAQYEHLIEVASRPGTSIRVLPFERGPHQAIGAAFYVFRFASGEPALGCVEMLDRVAVVEKRVAVARCVNAYEEAAALALGEAESLAFLRELAGR